MKQINKEDQNAFTNTYGYRKCPWCEALYKGDGHNCSALANKFTSPKK